ncbi:unnamed protein product [Ostreobium quekettii]|uniref:Endonuclease/exonuclease/phosphatase domain-containing protein n=1 Tax=Ostreobium quekettii TaxID=121088 RepID=A0A8S1JDL1_9CHLO|nr:unnamed protein product [Ostreobium quekettii]|eukprot:evm.model.scf_137.11 EVM.evm.TU.scf_137.11   scf_137:103537-107870(-)
MSLTIVSTQVPTGDAPICDVMLEPYIVIKEGDGPGTRCHVPDEGCLESTSRFRLRSRWFRAMIHRGSAVCNVHPDREAAIQCLLCLRAHAPVPLSFHCGPECLKEHWHLHRDNYHLRHYQNGGIENGYTSNGSSYRNSSNHEEWVEVGRTRCYVPTVDDVGCVLKFECSIADTHRPYYQDTGGLCAASITARVRPAPQPPVRAIIPLRHLAVPTPAKLLHEGRFTVLTYNILADLYATGDMYGTYCPAWALSWHYRRQNIIKELACYQADVVCLQEVQSDHYEDHVREAMEELGYIGVFKKKTTEVFIGRALAIDGCATFYRKDRFALIKKYEVEFNKAAMSTANHFPEPQRNAALNRLSKDNVALIVVLESVAPMAARQKQLICVANTHIHSNPEHSDVKLWQVHTLLKGLEKIAASAEIPIIVAGDFNSEPGSAAHTLMVTGSIDKTHPVRVSLAFSLHDLPIAAPNHTAYLMILLPAGDGC